MGNIVEDKRTAILHAALELFAENGFHCSPVSRMAEIAKVAVGSIYRYFNDKDEIIHAVFEMVDEKLSKDMMAYVDPARAKREQFITMITNLFRYLIAHPDDFKFLEQYYSSPYGIDKKREKILAVDKGQDSNPFARIFIPDETVSFRKMPRPIFRALIFGPVIYLLRDSLAGLITIDDEIIITTAEICWESITV